MVEKTNTILGKLSKDSDVKRIATVGDSITWGVCASDREQTSYPVDLQALIDKE